MECDFTEEEYELLASIQRSEGLHNHKHTLNKVIYTPLYKHPLPVSDHSYHHENCLRKVLSCKPSFQGMAAITQGDAWTLEEVYMRAGNTVLQPKNGNYPIHLAVQMRSIDCVMVLLNIGVDINVPNSMGFTPLFLAESSGAVEIVKILSENKAQKVAANKAFIPSSSILDVYPEHSGARKDGSKTFQMAGRAATIGNETATKASDDKMNLYYMERYLRLPKPSDYF